MKKIVAAILCMAMLLTFGACGNDQQKQNENQSEQGNGTGASSAVEKLYDEFDATLAAQIGPMPEKYGEVKVGAVIISLTNPFWANMAACYEAAAADLGIALDVQTGTTEGDTASQLDVLMTMADMDYNVIIVSPIDGTNLIPGIKKCNENGIKVINLGPGVDLAALEQAGGHLDAKITVKFEDQGKMVMADMMERMTDGGKIAILAGLAGAGQSEGRIAGAVDALKTNDEFEITNTVNCDWDASKAYDATKDLLVANPDLKGIFACNDVMALAAVEALKAEKIDNIYVYGVDLTDEARESIKSGGMTGSMSYSSVKYAAAALQMSIMLNEGQEIKDFVYLPLALANVDNIKDLDGWK